LSNINRTENCFAMGTETKKILTESEEQLLMSYFDNEATLFAKLRARRLLSHSPEAMSYFQSLGAFKKECSLSIKGAGSVDLWDGICARIEQEEHTQILLGERRVLDSSRPRSLLSEWLVEFANPRVWGLSAASVAAIFLFSFVMRSNNQGIDSTNNLSSPTRNWQSSIPTVEGVSTNSAVPIQGESLVDLSSLNTRRKLDRLSIRRAQRRSTDIPAYAGFPASALLGDSESNPVEIEWMRSDGRLSVLEGGPSGPTIIWVKRGDKLDAERPISNPRPRILEREDQLPRLDPSFR